jgi:hypothetical protein
MAKKKDPSITFLNQFGYNVVKLPRVGIEPLDVVGKDQTTQWLGPLSAVWQSKVATPKPSGPNPATSINGQKTSKLDLNFGLKVLANALAAFGATVPSLDFAYTRASKVEFSYGNVTSTVVAPFAAGEYLANGVLNSDSPVVKHYFLDPDSQAFLIVDVLKSDSISVTATDDHGMGIEVNIPAIQEAVGAKVEVGAGGGQTGTVVFTGKIPVTFGFIVNKIEFDGKNWSIQGTAPSGAQSFPVTASGATEPPAPAPVLLSSKCLVDV